MLWAKVRFHAQVWWRILTLRGGRPAPESLEQAYNRMVELENRRGN